MAKYTSDNPLHVAVELGEIDRVRALLDAGADPNVKDRHHVTPLMVAARKAHKEITKLLIERGADVNAKDRRSTVWEGRCTALHYAVNYGYVKTATILLEGGADPDCISQSWDTPLSTALMYGNQPMIDCLLAHGANPNGPEKCDMPPVVAAASKNDSRMVIELLHRGANPNRIGGNGQSALGVTLSVECAAELLAKGAQVNLKDRDGLTALHHKLIVGSPEFIQLLIKAGADVNAQPEGGWTPLQMLAMTPRTEIAEILLGAGADVNALGGEGVTALEICLSMKPDNFHEERQRLAEVLRAHGAKIAPELRHNSEKDVTQDRNGTDQP